MFRKKRRAKREAEIRASLLELLKQCVQALIQGPESEGMQAHSASASYVPLLGHTNNTNAFCCILEAIFIHGLENSFKDEFASFFAIEPDHMPAPNFWPVILVISHRDLIQQVSKLSLINSDVGKGRAWMRLALNSSSDSFTSYLSVLATDKHAQEYYKPTAFLRDEESCDAMLRVLNPINHLAFNFATNAAVLNTWTQTPLILSGIGVQAKYDPYIYPVLSGTDVAGTLTTEASKKPKTSVPIPQIIRSEEMFNFIISATPETNLFLPHDDDNSKITHDIDEAAPYKSDDTIPITQLPLDKEVLKNIEPHSDANEELHNKLTEEPNENYDEEESPEDVNEFAAASSDVSSLNRSISLIPERTGFDDMIRDWDASEHLENLPHFIQTLHFSNENESTGQDIDAVTEGYEVLDKPLQSPELVSALTTLHNEVGIDAQKFICKTSGCHTRVGTIYGKPRLCKYDGKYYCYECHADESSIIPARVIHSWDFTLYPVCCKHKEWLDSIYNFPVINIRLANSLLYGHVSELLEAQFLRLQLYYIQAYLFTCRIDEGKEYQRLFWPREHLYEHVHLVSIADLVEVSNGKLVPLLRRGVEYGCEHILQCEQCGPRGFICEICKDSKIIYPFQIAEAFTCPECRRVYHSSCLRTIDDCPRCQRIHQRRAADLESMQQELL